MVPIIHIGPYSFWSFGFAIGIGIVLAYLALAQYYRDRGIRIPLALFSAIIVPVGFLCARLDAVVFDPPADPHHLAWPFTTRLIYGGLTYFGGLLGAAGAWLLLIRLFRLPFLRTLDGLFCAGLGYAIGRIGCFLAGDGDYGIPSNLPWAVAFPHGTVPTAVRVHPTMLYITLWELLVFAILWRLSSPRHPPLRPGNLLGLYLIATGLGRFLVEFLSRNRIVAFGLKEAQLVSLVLIAIGAAAILLPALHEAKRNRKAEV